MYDEPMRVKIVVDSKESVYLIALQTVITVDIETAEIVQIQSSEHNNFMNS